MRANRFISILAVAILLACPLLAFASDDSNADVTSKEKGYYFEVTCDNDELKELLTDEYYIIVLNTVKQQILGCVFSPEFDKIAGGLVNPYMSFDSCTIKMGDYKSCAVGASCHSSAPLSILLKGVKVGGTYTKDPTSVTVIHKNDYFSDDMKKFIADNTTVTINKNDKVEFAGDAKIEMALLDIESYATIKDGYAVTDLGLSPLTMSIDCVLNVSVGTNDFDVDYYGHDYDYLNGSTVFNAELQDITSTTVVRSKCNDAIYKTVVSISIICDAGSKSDKYVYDVSEDTKKMIDEAVDTLENKALFRDDDDFTQYLSDVDSVDITEVINVDGKLDGTPGDAAKKIREYGGKCFLDSAAKKYCDNLNYKIIGIYQDPSSDTAIMISIIAVILVAAFAFGIVLVGKRRQT